MDMDVIGLLENVLSALGVKMRRDTDINEVFTDFDGGLRKQLFAGYDSSYSVKQFAGKCKDKAVYVMYDRFGMSYMIFWYQEEYTLIGPYMLAEMERSTLDMARKLNISLFHIHTLDKYVYSTPIVKDMEAIIFVFLENIFGKGQLRIERSNVLAEEEYENLKPYLEEDDHLSIELVEKRYQAEEQLLGAIEQGNITRANLAMAGMGQWRIPQRAETTFRDQKNMCLITNVLYRKAVQRAKVHPFHIDEVSNLFAKRIESANYQNELNKISQEMIRKYCLLVQNYSMKGYPETMGQILNYIDFHLAEPLSLKELAERFSINPSYLSRLFKKELGKTMTDYINEQRVEKSLMYLTVTGLQIQEVAARVGIVDENYFSRIFKKMKHITPKEYRGIVRRQEVAEKGINDVYG